MTEVERLIDELITEAHRKSYERFIHEVLYGKYHGPAFPEWEKPQGLREVLK